MKKYFIVFFYILAQHGLFAQNYPNGTFEEWQYTSQESIYANYWRWGAFNTPCSPFNVLLERTDDSFQGNWAAKVESKICYDDFGQPRLQAGHLYTSETESGLVPAPLTWSIEYTERPQELSFHYQFHREGIDSAAVYLLLFNYDIDTHFVDTVATASGYISDETTTYEEFVLPIDYLKETQPSFIHIIFICSKTIGDLGQVTYTPAYENAHPGTTLWIDNVVLRGGTVNTTSPQEKGWNFSAYPNPTEDEIHIDIPQQIQVDKVQVYDNQGRVVKEFKDFGNTLNISDISKGIYYLKLETNKGTRFKKVIKK